MLTILKRKCFQAVVLTKKQFRIENIGCGPHMIFSVMINVQVCIHSHLCESHGRWKFSQLRRIHPSSLAKWHAAWLEELRIRAEIDDFPDRY